MFKKILTLASFIFFSLVFSQNKQLSNNAEISIITSGPGINLYEKFGHTSIRVKDPSQKLDTNYNYGIFDFDAPNFYSKFTQGYMLYKLASYDFFYAIRNAKEDKRWMKEQILDLTLEEKNAFYNYLENNLKPENVNYYYDPYFENCATKPRDIIKEILGEKVFIPSDGITNELTLRELMNNEIHQNTWGSFGINIALGNKLDKKTTTEDAMYLPDFLYHGLSASNIKANGIEKPLIKKENTLLNFEEIQSKPSALSPSLVFTMLLFIVILITYKNYKNQTRAKWLDFFIFFSTGLIGLLIIYLWFFTNHSTAPNNFNFLWTFAPNLIVSFLIAQKNPPKWINIYVKLLLVLLVFAVIIWIAKIQLLSSCLVPVFMLLAFRYWFLQKTLNR